MPATPLPRRSHSSRKAPTRSQIRRMHHVVQPSRSAGLAKTRAPRIFLSMPPPGAITSGPKWLAIASTSFAARKKELVRQRVSIEHGDAGALENPAYRRFPGGDPAGEPDPKHALLGARCPAGDGKSDGVCQQHCDGEWSDSTGNRGVGGRPFPHRHRMDITDQGVPVPPEAASRLSSSPKKSRTSSSVVARFIPTSTTTAPSRMASAPIIAGRPIAVQRMSASRHTAGRSRVREWQTVTVAC